MRQTSNTKSDETPGFVYVVVGPRYVKFVAYSIATLRKQTKAAITILTNKQSVLLSRLVDGYNVEIRAVDADLAAHKAQDISPDYRYARVLKTQAALFCPHNPCVYIDTDTFIFSPLTSLFSIVAKAPMALALSQVYPTIGDTARAQKPMSQAYYRCDQEYTVAETGPKFPYRSSSTIVWRRESAVLNMFKMWYEEWLRFNGCDMLPLARALYRTKLDVAALPRAFNKRSSQHTKDVVILTPSSGEIDKVCRHYFPEIYERVNKIIAAESP